MSIESLELRLSAVRANITAKANSLGLETQPTLVVVTKNHPVSLVSNLVKLGERNFGENRDQEASVKSRELLTAGLSEGVEWHFVGQLQTNKVKSVLEYATYLHTVDRPSLLSELKKRTADRAENPLRVFLEINLTDRDDRGGVSPAELLSFAERVAEVPSLHIVGLMAVARPGVDPKADFETVARLRERFLVHFPNSKQLSMGMSGDYLEAMDFGATHLRIGTAITGDRAPQN